MQCPDLADLPAPPTGRSGWPWTEPAKQSLLPSASLPAISIVIPSYNQADFVAETLRAILLQGYPKLEVLFADDSTDRTLEVIEPYLPWIELLPPQVNRGQSHAINRGFRVAGGDIVTWISTDDVYLPGAFHLVAEAWLDNPDVGALVGAFRFIDPESRPLSDDIAARLLRPAPLDLSVEDLASWRLHQVATFYTAAGLDAAGRYVREDLLYVMDRDLIFRVASKKPLTLLAEPLAEFRLHPESKSASTVKILAFAREFASLHYAYLSGEPELDRRRTKIARQWIVKGHLRNGLRGDGRWRRLRSLCIALGMSPSVAFKRSYWVRWADLLGLAAPLRRALGKEPDRTRLERAGEQP